MAKHVCVAVLFCILAYVESTPFHPFGPAPYYGAPPPYAMAPIPCGYPMMPPPCVRFPFSCPPPNGPSPCQNRNNNNFGPQRPQQVEPGFSMSINWGDPSPQENPDSMKRHIIRPYNPYRRIRKNKGRRRRKFRGSRRKPYGRQPMPWQTNGGSYGGPYARPTGSGWGRRLNDEGGFIPNDNSDPYNDDHGESPYRHDEAEDGNFDVGGDDGDDYEEADDYDDDEGHDNGIRHDEGESYDDDQGYDDGQRYDEGDDYDGDDDGDDY